MENNTRKSLYLWICLGLIVFICYGVKICQNVYILQMLKHSIACYEEENLLENQYFFFGGFFGYHFEDMIQYLPMIVDNELIDYNISVYASDLDSSFNEEMFIDDYKLFITYCPNEKNKNEDYMKLETIFDDTAKISYIYQKNDKELYASDIKSKNIGSHRDIQLKYIEVIAPRENYSSYFMTEGWEKLSGNKFIKETEALVYVYEETYDDSLKVKIYNKPVSFDWAYYIKWWVY